MNDVFYIKPANNNLPEAVKLGFIHALQLISQKNFSNIKFILSHSNLLDAPPTFISDGIDAVNKGLGVAMVTSLKKGAFSIPRFPTDNDTTGINLVLANNNPRFGAENTVGILIWADHESFPKIERYLSLYSIDLVAVLFSETIEMDELLCATKAQNISAVADPNVQAYQNNFSATENTILDRLKSISLTNGASHNLNRDRIDSVVAALEQSHFRIPYKEFLGYLVNDVGYNIQDSIELLERKHTYFGR